MGATCRNPCPSPHVHAHTRARAGPTSCMPAFGVVLTVVLTVCCPCAGLWSCMPVWDEANNVWKVFYVNESTGRGVPGVLVAQVCPHASPTHRRTTPGTQPDRSGHAARTGACVHACSRMHPCVRTFPCVCSHGTLECVCARRHPVGSTRGVAASSPHKTGRAPPST